MRDKAFAGIIGLSLLASSAFAQTETEFSYEGWTGHKRANDPDNGCIMGKHVTKDVYFVVYANANEGFGFGVSVSSWDLPVGDELAGSVSFDHHARILLTGTVIEPEIVLFPGGAEEDSLAPLLSNSRQMRLSYGHSKFGLSLKGSSKALELLGDCAENRINQPPPQVSEKQARTSLSLTSLPIKSGYYALTDGTCAQGFGPSTIYTDGKTLSWPSSGCRFEHISQTGPSTFEVKQTCGRNADDIGTEQATYINTNKTSFLIETWGEKGNYCEPSTLPIADRERADPPIYAPSNLGAEPSSNSLAGNYNSNYQERPAVTRRQDNARGTEDRAGSDDTSNRQTGANDNSSLEPTQYRNPAESVPGGKAITLSSVDEDAVKELVGLHLRDETSARFRNLAAAEFPDGTYTVCGFVNGKNQFGAFTGYTLFRSTYLPDTKILTSFMMANNENIAALCTLNGVALQ